MASDLSSADVATSEAVVGRSMRVTHEVVLAAVLAAEIAVFCAIGTNFMSWKNAFEIARLFVEVGLLAVAMTPVVISGGIDLSVGSLMGLSAVLFGMLWRDAHLPIPVTVLVTLVAGAVAGSLNGVLIAKLRLPPLIVTLGTYSLFRGLAEGLTRGVDNFTGLPDSFLFLGQGFLFGWVPAQLPIFVVVVIGFWILQQRTTIGRGLHAIGFSPEGARYAGIPVERRLMLVYVLSGLMASLAAIIYVAHLGQAKADAGTGYELAAITAVVLGGTSIFGGRGTIQGTVLGLVAIAVLQNGLRLAGQPAELAGILMGALLLTTISLERWSSWRGRGVKAVVDSRIESKELDVKNSQVAVLCVVFLLGAVMVAVSNWLLFWSLVKYESTPHGPAAPATTEGTAAALTNKKITVAMMPKSKGNAYFIACRKGAEEAAKELGVDLIWDGPTDPDPAKQNEIIEAWITRGVDVIAVSAENRDAISSVLKKARRAGSDIITFDADTGPDSREYFVNQATPAEIGYKLMDRVADVTGGKGEFAVITASLTAANQNEWLKFIEKRRAALYPGMKIAVLRACDDLQKKAFDETATILNAYPDVKVILAICSPAVPGAAEAVKQSGRKDVKVVGLGLPNDNKQYVHEGITPAVVLWNTMDLGYLTVYTATAVARGKLMPEDKTLAAGRLGEVKIQGDNVLLGEPFTFKKENIDQFDF